MLNKIAIAAAVAAVPMLVPAAASAASQAITTTDLNVRSGPGATYARFATIPARRSVTVHGCLTGYNWCDVSWGGDRGWVAGGYLAYRERAIPSVGFSIGLPVITFEQRAYHDRHFRGRDWHYDRDRREHRRDVREARRDIRDARRDIWDARRDLREFRQGNQQQPRS